jgi:glutathione-independent formaldehyde dehydrogenase
MASNSNRGVVCLKPGSVEVQKIDFPTFRNPVGKTLNHGVILKVATTNICGSGQYMVRGRTTRQTLTLMSQSLPSRNA